MYSGIGGDLILHSNGDLTIGGELISSSDIDDNTSSISFYSDGFSMLIDEDSVLFVVTGEDAAMVYVAEGFSTTDRSTIITKATQDESVFEYQITRVNPWLKRNMSPEYISFDEVYSGALGDIEFYSNGDSRIFGDGSLSSGSIDYLMTNNQMIVYSDGFLLRPDENHYYLFISNGDGTATLYLSTSEVSSSFTREAVIANNNYVLPYTLSSS